MAAEVWLVTGAQGSGKSTVADLPARQFERGVHVRGGQFYRWVVKGWVGFDDRQQPTEARRLLELRYDCQLGPRSRTFRPASPA